MLRIIADEVLDLPRAAANLPVEWVRVPSGSIRPALLRGAGALLVRSVTTVDADLLADSAVRFVGTATAGVNHVDLQFLEKRGIAFSAAPACNAASVADFVCATVARYLTDTGGRLDRLKLGIVGFGATGSRVHARLAPLARACATYDPFVATPESVGSTGDLVDCDIVTLHVPLTTAGPAPTAAMIGRDFCEALAPGSLLINAARGEVMAPAAYSTPREHLRLAIDVWEHEPAVAPAAVENAWQATPHIAGHTVDARARGGRMICQALCRHFDLPLPQDSAETGGEDPNSQEVFNIDKITKIVERTRDARITATTLVEEVADLAAMSGRFKTEITTAAAAGRPLPPVFTGLRARFGERREFGAHRILWRGDPVQGALLRQLGFQVIYRAK